MLLSKTKPNYENGTTKKSEAFNGYLSIEPSTTRFLDERMTKTKPLKIIQNVFGQ